jgi:hypothetical protein
MILVTISELLAQAAIENPDLSFEFINAALQSRNEVLAGQTESYSFDETLEDVVLLAIVKARENETTIKVSLDDL